MTDANRIEQMESLLRKVWAVMLLADSKVSDPHVKAAFAKVDAELRKAKIGSPREGVVFIEPAETPR